MMKSLANWLNARHNWVRSYTTFSYSMFRILWLNCSTLETLNLLNRQMPVVVFEYFDLNVSINKFCTIYFLDPWHFCCTINNTHLPYQEQEKYHLLRRNKWTKLVITRKFWRNPQQMNQPQVTNINAYLTKWSYNEWLFPSCHRKANWKSTKVTIVQCYSPFDPSFSEWITISTRYLNSTWRSHFPLHGVSFWISAILGMPLQWPWYIFIIYLMRSFLVLCIILDIFSFRIERV